MSSGSRDERPCGTSSVRHNGDLGRCRREIPPEMRPGYYENCEVGEEKKISSSSPRRPMSIKEAATRLTDSKSTGWKLRLEAINWLKEEVLKPEGSKLIVSNLVLLANPLQAQCRDLRSAVVRETCALLKTFAQVLQDKFATVAHVITKTLLMITGSGNKVIAGYCEECAFEIVRHTKSQKSIDILVKLCTSRSKLVREHAGKCLYICLESWSPSNWLHQTESLSKGIKLGLEDTSKAARETAKKSFVVLSNHAPEDAKELLLLLDKRTLSRLSYTGTFGGHKEDGAASTTSHHGGHRRSASSRPSLRVSTKLESDAGTNEKTAQEDLPKPPPANLRTEWVITQRVQGDPKFWWNSRTNEVSYSPWVQMIVEPNQDGDDSKMPPATGLGTRDRYFFNVETGKTSWTRPEDTNASPRHIDTPSASNK
eukprot:g2495.t1